MARCYFDSNGKFDLWENDLGNPEMPDSLTEIPDDTALWRLSYDYETATLIVKYPTMTDSEAEAQLDIDIQAEHNAFMATLEAAAG